MAYTLYFVDSDGKRSEIVKHLKTMPGMYEYVKADLETRLPDFVSYYTRVNGIMGQDEEVALDFGSHSKFYVAIKEDEQ